MSHIEDAPPVSPIRVLLAQEETPGAPSLEKRLENVEDLPLEIERADGIDAALERLREGGPHVVLIDLALPDALEMLPRLKSVSDGVPILALTECDDAEFTLNALRLGAHDQIAKDRLNPRLVARLIQRAVEQHRVARELEHSREREHYLATHDRLTDLPNRFYFQELLRRAMANASRSQKSVAILFLDLDRFKNINDTLGHAIGDELLKMTAERLSQVTRRSDIVARLGGDEFGVMLQNVKRDHAPAIVAEKILNALARPFPIGERGCWVTASVGIAMFPRDGIDVDALLRNADIALYEAKSQGSNAYHFHAEQMNQLAAERLGLENSLHEAIAQGQFALHFQPQVDISTGELLGAEALLRWNHPERGLLAPEAFLGVAEEGGMSDAIGLWMLRSACEHAAAWNQSRPEKIRVGVNVAGSQLGRKGFVDDVVQVLRATDLEASQLELEIAERNALSSGGVTRATLLVLRRLGVRVSVDDFGTVSTSLAALKGVPLDGFKIHREFIENIPNDPTNATIARALIRMARGLGLVTAAEGVQTREQLRFLYTHGCHMLQGDLLGAPVAAEAFAEQLRSKNPPWVVDLGDLR